MSKHLTLSDRAIIEKYLAQDMPFSYIIRWAYLIFYNKLFSVIHNIHIRNHMVNGMFFSYIICLIHFSQHCSLLLLLQ